MQHEPRRLEDGPGPVGPHRAQRRLHPADGGLDRLKVPAAVALVEARLDDVGCKRLEKTADCNGVACFSFGVVAAPLIEQLLVDGGVRVPCPASELVAGVEMRAEHPVGIL